MEGIKLKKNKEQPMKRKIKRYVKIILLILLLIFLLLTFFHMHHDIALIARNLDQANEQLNNLHNQLSNMELSEQRLNDIIIKQEQTIHKLETVNNIKVNIGSHVHQNVVHTEVHKVIHTESALQQINNATLIGVTTTIIGGLSMLGHMVLSAVH